MDLHKGKFATEKHCFTGASDEELVCSWSAELPRAASDALSDTIVQALMAADGIARESIEKLMCRIIAQRYPEMILPTRSIWPARSKGREPTVLFCLTHHIKALFDSASTELLCSDPNCCCWR